MSEETVQEEQEPESALVMDDDAIASMSLEEFEASTGGKTEPVEEEEDEPAEEAENDEPEEEDGEDSADSAEEQEEAAEEADEEPEEDAEKEPTDEAPEETDEPDKDESETEVKEDEKSEDAIDYKAKYEELMAPFTANGREMKVSSVEDIRQLMQMGANYNKKMAALKPNLRLMKMLENNELLDENRLSFLIDLDKKNPDAIKKLLKDGGIDPLDVDVNSETEYKPETYTVSDGEVELDTVLSEISDTPSYADTINIISNKWDDASKKILVDNPDIIRAINAQVGNGIYEQITTVVEQERMLGRLNGVSDIAAYKQIGDRLHAEGKFAAPAAETKASEGEEIQPKPVNKPANPKLKQKKRAAAPAKRAPTKGKAVDFNPLDMSDDEFEKAAAKLKL